MNLTSLRPRRKGSDNVMRSLSIRKRDYAGPTRSFLDVCSMCWEYPTQLLQFFVQDKGKPYLIREF